MTASLNQWDAIVGVKGRLKLGNDSNWFIPLPGRGHRQSSQFTW